MAKKSAAKSSAIKPGALVTRIGYEDRFRVLLITDGYAIVVDPAAEAGTVAAFVVETLTKLE